MNDILYVNPKLEVRLSRLHGYGVFAKDDIYNGELLEECHHIRLAPETNVKDYVFSWPNSKEYKDVKYRAIVLGFGSIYNSSKCEETRNTDWTTEENRNLYIFKANKDT